MNILRNGGNADEIHLSNVVGGWIVVMELFPGFSLYRGLYEFGQASFIGNYMGTKGMQWGDLSDSTNGMRDVIIIIFCEWLFVLFVSYYMDQALATGSGKNPLSFLKRRKNPPSSFRKPSLGRQGSKVFVDMDKPDVIQEVFVFGFHFEALLP